MNPFIETILAETAPRRDRSFESLCAGRSHADLLRCAGELESFRQTAGNLYHRVRAIVFLYAIHRFRVSDDGAIPPTGTIPLSAHADFQNRRYEEALSTLNGALARSEVNGALSSGLAACYHALAFQTLADQVRRSVRSSRGNQWTFRVGHPDDHPLRVRPEMLSRPGGSLLYPVLRELTPVRLDLTHCAWSDIFFLGMDQPEGARVVNISVDLGVQGRDSEVRPPVESYVRVIEEPVLRLTSIDLNGTKDIASLDELFNFGNDHLGLLKAGVIASGLVPPSFEGTNHSIARILENTVGRGMGIELVTKVNDIPKGSRLAVSTNLLASIIAALMRATGQTRAIEGPLEEDERRLTASRAILGEWLGGSGGGWQDSGGVWPGIKAIEGALAAEGDPEYGVSRGALLPSHRVLQGPDLHPEIAERLAASLVLIHGGMAQNVGPILEMVTEKYLLRSENERRARGEVQAIFAGILVALREGDMRALGERTTANWNGPLKQIVPWVTNEFTEAIIAAGQRRLGKDFWGFLMLGGMSGGGMAMIVNPARRDEFVASIREIMAAEKARLEYALPFAMDPVVYDFAINRFGTRADLLRDREALMPGRYYALHLPVLVRTGAEALPYGRRAELDYFASERANPQETSALFPSVISNLFNVGRSALRDERRAWDDDARRMMDENGFDPVQHDRMRGDLVSGRIGLARNRLPISTLIEDVQDGDMRQLAECAPDAAAGQRALHEGRVAVLTLAGGVGSRWTSGSGVIKALNPFLWTHGRHRSFLELHLAKSRKSGQAFGTPLPHAISTSFLTHAPTALALESSPDHGYAGPLYLSPGRSISHRLVPMRRDLVFLWEEMAQEMLDAQRQKVRDGVRASLTRWAGEAGEGTNYTDNVALQRFNPPGHWYEVPNLLRNGVLKRMLADRPQLDTLMVHNVDTLGANVDPAAYGAHLASGDALTFEVVPRRFDDHGGGIARVDGRVRLLEGLAQPREEDELALRYYNSLTTWVSIDGLLAAFELRREDLGNPVRVDEAVRRMAARMPTYLTIKEVKRRWGHGQEDIFPVAQFEKLWGDMTALPDLKCGFLSVPRQRGRQLKGPEQLDPWANDGGKEYLESLCQFD